MRHATLIVTMDPAKWRVLMKGQAWRTVLAALKELGAEIGMLEGRRP